MNITINTKSQTIEAPFKEIKSSADLLDVVFADNKKFIKHTQEKLVT